MCDLSCLLRVTFCELFETCNIMGNHSLKKYSSLYILQSNLNKSNLKGQGNKIRDVPNSTQQSGQFLNDFKTILVLKPLIYGLRESAPCY